MANTTKCIQKMLLKIKSLKSLKAFKKLINLILFALPLKDLVKTLLSSHPLAQKSHTLSHQKSHPLMYRVLASNLRHQRSLLYQH